MSLLKNPHNLFFEELMGRTEVCQDFLQNYLPDEIVRELDFSTRRLSWPKEMEHTHLLQRLL